VCYFPRVLSFQWTSGPIFKYWEGKKTGLRASGYHSPCLISTGWCSQPCTRGIKCLQILSTYPTFLIDNYKNYQEPVKTDLHCAVNFKVQCQAKKEVFIVKGQVSSPWLSLQCYRGKEVYLSILKMQRLKKSVQFDNHVNKMPFCHVFSII
jgi:hypothetical protein